MSESQIQKKIYDYLVVKGYYVVKVQVASKAGVPDILACIEGCFVGIEVKKPTTLNTVSKLQEYNLRKIRDANGYGAVASSVADVEALVRTIKDNL